MRPLDRHADRGSALMLVPAGVLVLILLGAIAIDSAVVVLAQRDLQNRTAAVANDAATIALDDFVFYGDGEVRLSPDRAATYTAAAFSPGNKPDHYRSWDAEITTGATTVEVRAWAEVSSIFLRAVPGLPDTTRVEARSLATARGA